MNVTIPFEHRMSAHCETGTLSSQLAFHGLTIPESLVFGIGSGIFFGYFNNSRFAFPTFIVRNKPGQIRKNLSDRLGIKFHAESFKTPEKAQAGLDKILEKGIPVAVQVDFFFMEYLPQYLRVHINVHFINVVGKNGNNYLISDCYHPKIVELDEQSLMKGRFAGGNMAPEGFLFYPEFIPKEFDWPKAVHKGIKKACFYMLKIPIPFLGVKGMRRFGRHIVEWPKLAINSEDLSHQLSKINVLLEDQGTGGAGFRFMYATFLKKAAEILEKPALNDFSKQMMEIGDNWRGVSLYAARLGRNRDFEREHLLELGKLIDKQADREEAFFKALSKSI
ncbi:MAG TPA: BtrH N-terminal domain-containing protein [Bacteroidales bacterium]|nr:BtrH N-terminal domain-containing protein [Bacteroidales bacterium]